MDKATIKVSQEYLKDLERKVSDLKTLIDVSVLLSSMLDFNTLMTVVMEKAKEVMDAEGCSILLYNRETGKLEFEVVLSSEETTSEVLKKKITLDMGQGIAGWVAKEGKPLLVKDAMTDRRFFKDADLKTGFITKSLIAVPLMGRRGLIGVAEILNPRTKACFTEYDTELFQTLSRQVAIAIENALFHDESIKRERLKQELEIASQVQKSFLPKSPFLRKGDLSVSAVNISAEKVGGDLYDFIEFSDDSAGILIGDVSGKGISAALYMAKVMSDFHAAAHDRKSPASVFNSLNSLLQDTPMGMFLTACYMIVDVSSGKVSISSAGHPPPILMTSEGVTIMDVPSGPPLGILSQEYPLSEVQLKDGDRMIILTDGVYDAKNRKGDRIGFDSIVDHIMRCRQDDQIIERIIEFIEEFSRGSERADDLTMVEIRWKA